MQFEEDCRNCLAEATGFLRSLLQVFKYLLRNQFLGRERMDRRKKAAPALVAYTEANFPGAARPYLRAMVRMFAERPSRVRHELMALIRKRTG